jgi:hypothetical protein
MSRLNTLVREHFTSRGKAKKPYATAQEAARAARQHHKRSYLCKFCGAYHLGGSGR